MRTIILRLWDRLRDRWSSNPGPPRLRLQTRRLQAGAPANASAPADPQAAPPLAWRYRAPSSGFSMTVGQVEELNRLLKTIRPLPQGATKVLQELNSPDASAATVADAIECEPVMAASVLRISNSTAIGLQREITSVSEAVAYLGFSTTKSLLLRFSVDGLLPNSRPGHGYDGGKLWVHATAVAQVAEEVARRAGRTDPSLALTAGLLHDIGKLVINSKFKDALDQLWSPCADPSEGILNRERRLFNADHAIIGSALATEWKLPQDLIDIIRLHHAPYGQLIDLQPETRRALFSVHIANQLVKCCHAYCEEMEIDDIPNEMTSELGLPDWTQLLDDGRLRFIVDRVIMQNGGATDPDAVAA